MLLSIDVGNTNITLGAFLKKELKMVARMATNSSLTADQYAVDLKNILALKEVDFHEIHGAVIGSVVPQVGAALTEAVRELCGIDPIVLGPGIKTGLNIKIDNPGQLGADLAAGAVAAAHLYPAPCIIFDLGTATTISVLDADNNFLGGAIAAGLHTTLDALASRTAQLPHINIEAPDKCIGTNTVDSMKSGLVFGAAAMIDGMIDRIEDEIGGKAAVVATGGLSAIVVPLCRREIIYNDNLLLEGMRLIYERNKK